MLLIDMSHLFQRNLHMNKKGIFRKADIGQPLDDVEQGFFEKVEEDGVEYWFNRGYLSHLIMQNVLSFAKSFGACATNPVILAIDSKPSWRHAWYVENCKDFPEYKGQTYKGKRKKDKEIPWKVIFAAYADTLAAIAQNSDFHTMAIDDCEADDIIGVLAKYGESCGHDVYVISSDKDFKQLMSSRVHVYDPIKKLMVPKDDVEAVLNFHCVLGDDGDNILPIRKGVGDKTALKICADLKNVLAVDPDARARYEFNRTLIDFDRIPTRVSEKILNYYKECVHDECTGRYNSIEMTKFCMKYKLKSIYARINEFKLASGSRQPSASVKPKATVEQMASNTIEAFFA